MLPHTARLLLTILTLFSASAFAVDRVALVIGNGKYQIIESLDNPPNDVRLVSDSLKNVGFDVTLLIDAEIGEMDAAISTFHKRLDDSGRETIGLFYYAGHGVSYDGQNWLIPVEAKVEAGPDLKRRAVSAQYIMEMMESSKNATNIMILDACRNNPFKDVSLSRNRSLARGMAEMHAPEGSFIAFSTASGEVAYDGSGDYSPFAEAFAAEVATPAITITDMMVSVNARVRKATDGLGEKPQIPWVNYSLSENFWFNRGAAAPAVAPVPAAATQLPAQAPKKSRDVLEAELWADIKDSGDPLEYEIFLKKYPDGNYADFAKARMVRFAKKAEQPANTAPAMNQPATFPPAATQSAADRSVDSETVTLCRQFAGGDSESFADCMAEMEESGDDYGMPPGGRQPGTTQQGGNFPSTMPNQQMPETAVWYDDDYNQWQVTISGDNFVAGAMIPGFGSYQLRGQSQGYQVSYSIFDESGLQIGYGGGNITDASHIAVTSYWANGIILGSTTYHVNHAPQ